MQYKRNDLRFLFWFGIIWTIFVGIFDVVIAYGLFQQFRSNGYETTKGTIVASSVAKKKGSKGSTHYSAEIRYQYAVGSEAFTGNKLRYSINKDQKQSRAEYEIRNHPVGKEVTVYYDPKEPKEAVLIPGTRAGEFLPILFLIPFNLMGLGLIYAGRSELAMRRPGAPYIGGRRMVLTSTQARIGLEAIGPLGMFMIWQFVLMFVGIFAIGVPYDMKTPNWMVLAYSGGATGLALLMAALRKGKLASGALDLTIDYPSRTVRVPKGHGRKAPLVVTFDQVRGFEVQTRQQKVKNGIQTFWMLFLNVADRDTATALKLTESTVEMDIAALKLWLETALRPPE